MAETSAGECLITNLPRQSCFLDRLMALLPQAETLDILTSDFEIASFILLAGQWQSVSQVRMVVSRAALQAAKPAGEDPVFDQQNQAIEREKAKTDDLSELIAVSEALFSNRLQIGVHTKDTIHGSAYIIQTRQGEVCGFLGPAGFTEGGETADSGRPLQDVEKLQCRV